MNLNITYKYIDITMTSPYINTKLYKSIILHPHQMNNNIYINLKKNLEDAVVKKCMSNYGLILKVIEIIEIKDGIIEAENVEASALFPVIFSCRLCKPLKNKIIICQIDRVNKVLITARNGPITVIIPNNRINESKFFIDNNNNIRIKENKSEQLTSNSFVKTLLTSIEFNDGDNQIKAIASLEDMATEQDIQKFYKDLYDQDVNLVDYQKFLDANK